MFNENSIIERAAHLSEFTHFELLTAIGNYCLDNDKPAAALAYYNKALEIMSLKKTDTSLLHHKGKALNKLGRYLEALTCYDIAIKAGSMCFYLQSDRCETLYHLGRYSEALKECDRIDRNVGWGLNGMMEELRAKTILRFVEKIFNKSEYSDYKFDGTRLIKLTVDNIVLDGSTINTFAIEPNPSQCETDNIICTLDEIIYILEREDGITILTEYSDIYINKTSCTINSQERTLTINQLYKNYKSVSDDKDSYKNITYVIKEYGLTSDDLVVVNPVLGYNPEEEINSYWYDTHDDDYVDMTYKYVPGMHEVIVCHQCLGYVLKK